MFFKGSRYKDLPEIHTVNTEGRAIRSKTMRWIPDTPGAFLHTVNESERLDLLAYKYYGNPKKWWLICDANPQFAFPPDVLDRSPFVQEAFCIDHTITWPIDPAHGSNILLQLPILIKELKNRRGIHKVLADMFQPSLEVTYNQKEIKQEEIIEIINSNGFNLQGIIKGERIGQKIIIPPNKVF